jgi:phytoene dehydrogenase-like protein
MGGISEALANAARHHGVEIRLNSPVAKVLVRGGSAIGIALESGDEIAATTVISNADPKRSLLQLVDSADLDDEFVTDVEGIDQRGSMARIHLLIDELPAYLGFDASDGPQHHGHQMLGASVENFEATCEAQRRGEIPARYVIEAVIQSTTDPTLAPEGKHTLTLGVQQLPFELANGQTWDGIKEGWGDKVVAELCEYAPNLKDHILDRAIITPQDLERDYLITGGNIFHGQMYLDQLFDSRPLASISSYRTPINGYYLCGVGMHPGGGVMGASGHNAAQVVLADAAGAGAGVRTARRSGGSRGVVDRIMDTEPGRKAGYRLARHKVFRPFVRRASRRGKES